MAEYVRVRDTSGHEISVRADVPEGHPRGVLPGMEVLDKDPLNRSGEPRGPLYRVPLGEEPAASAVPGTHPIPSPTDPVPAVGPAPENTTDDGRTADSEGE